jgi:two-component system sensor histidine kinase YesM
MRILKKTRYALQNAKILHKLIFSFLMLTTVPLAIISLLYFTFSSKTIDLKSSLYIHDILGQTAQNMEYHINDIKNVSLSLLTDSDIQSLLSADDVGFSSDYQKGLARKKIENVIFSNIQNEDGIKAVYIYSMKGNSYAVNKTSNTYSASNVDLNIVKSAEGKIVWLGSNSEYGVVIVAQTINDMVTMKPLGYVVLYVDESYIFNILTNIKFAQNNYVMLIDSNGNYVSYFDKKELGKPVRYLDVKNIINGKQPILSSDKVNGQSCMISYVPLNEGNWDIVTILPKTAYNKDIQALGYKIIIIMLCTFSIVILISIWIAFGISKPIKKLSHSINMFGQGDFAVRSDINTKDEIGTLSENFNHMVSEINNLIQSVYEEKILKQQAQFQSLQMQINPHFLYNTLDTINWIARINGVDEIAEVATSLANLMRYTISGSDFTIIGMEMENLNNYICIQKHRYGNDLSVQLSFSPDTLNIKIPKLIIQPIVENAISHGVMGHGKILVSCVCEDQLVYINVEDDGEGMSSEKIKEILNDNKKQNSSEKQSIGINSVNERIKLFYGSEYGVSIVSETGKMTKVTICFPVQYN